MKQRLASLDHAVFGDLDSSQTKPCLPDQASATTGLAAGAMATALHSNEVYVIRTWIRSEYPETGISLGSGTGPIISLDGHFVARTPGFRLAIQPNQNPRRTRSLMHGCDHARAAHARIRATSDWGVCLRVQGEYEHFESPRYFHLAWDRVFSLVYVPKLIRSDRCRVVRHLRDEV